MTIAASPPVRRRDLLARTSPATLHSSNTEDADDANRADMDAEEELGRDADRRSLELDTACRIPDDLYRRAAAAGLFHQLVVAEFGGLASAPIDWFRRGVELAHHEASFGWVVTQGAAELGWISAGGDEDWARDLFGDPLATSASSTAGRATLTVAGTRSRFGGRWAFNTGCHGASWIGGLALLTHPAGTSDAPQMRWGWVPATHAQIIEDWDPTGLRGSGSHTTIIEEQDIPTAWTFDPAQRTDNDRGPYRAVVGNGNWPIATSVAATQLGNARRAIEETRTVMLTKLRQPDRVPLAEHAGAQRELVLIEGYWNAACAGVERALDSMWAQASEDGALTTRTRIELHAANVAADQLSVQIVDRACVLSGTAALPRHSVLSRCRRDAHALHQHIATGPASIEANATMSLGRVSEHMLV